MNGAVPSEDATAESFARILGRLTRAPRRDTDDLDALADDAGSVSVSISPEAAAALDGSRKRMAPVRETRQAAGRGAKEASEISYEQALRTHRRGRPAEVAAAPRAVPGDEPDGPERLKPETMRAEATAARRVEAEANALSALRKAKVRMEHGRDDRAREAAADGGARREGEARRRPKQVVDGAGESSRRQSARRSKSSAAMRDQGGDRDSQGPVLSSLLEPKTRKSAKTTAIAGIAGSGKAKARSTAAVLEAKKESTGRKASRRGSQGMLPGSALSAAGTLDLEAVPGSAALMQRQSSVSIRLSAVESEQLRQRAAESGISVSAYMRSCVLEAEHLRSQVKQALVELRTSHRVRSVPELDSQPLLPVAYAPTDGGSGMMRTGLAGFLSGAFALVLGRFHR